MINVVYMLVRIAQFLMFLASFGLIYKIYCQKGTTGQRLLLMAAVCAMLDMYGYLETLSVTTEQSTKWAVRSQYVSALLFLVLMLHLLLIFCDYQVHKVQTVLFWVVNAAFLILLLIDEGLNILFTDYSYEEKLLAVQVRFRLRPIGCLYVFYVLVLLFAILYVGISIRKKQQKELVISLIAVSVVLPVIAYVLNLAGLTGGYDAAPVLMMVSCGVIYRANRNYHLLDDGQIARETILDELGEGYIILDSARNLKSYNTIAAMLYPELEQAGERETVIELIYLHNHDVIEHNGKICNVVISELKEHGDLTGYVMWLYDCTDEYYYMKDLEQLRERTDELDRTRKLFLNHMTIGFDSPLQLLSQRAEALCGDTQTVPEVQEKALDIFGAAQKLRDMVSVMMDYTGDEKKPMAADEEYQTRELLARFSEILSERKKGRCTQVALTPAQQLPNCWYGCRAGVEQLLDGVLRCAGIAVDIAGIELVVNSEMRYEDTLLILSLCFDDKGVTTGEMNRMSALMKSGRTNVDTDADYIPYIYCRELLYRVRGTAACSVEQGRSRLDLMIPQKVIDQRPYPLQTQTMTEPAEVQMEELSDTKERSDRTVMVVDDNLIYLHEMDNWLRELKLRTIMAKSGAECLRILNRRRVDLIFLDQMMPEMEGTQVLREIRRIEQEQEIETPVPVVILTADDSIGARKRYMESGFDDYVAKPIEKKKICEEVRKYLEITE